MEFYHEMQNAVAPILEAAKTAEVRRMESERTHDGKMSAWLRLARLKELEAVLVTGQFI